MNFFRYFFESLEDWELKFYKNNFWLCIGFELIFNCIYIKGLLYLYDCVILTNLELMLGGLLGYGLSVSVNRVYRRLKEKNII